MLIHIYLQREFNILSHITKFLESRMLETGWHTDMLTAPLLSMNVEGAALQDTEHIER